MTRRQKRRGMGQVHGETHAAAKLTEAIVLSLRARAGALKYPGGMMYRAAERHQVAVSAISNAIHGVTWAHLPGAIKKRFHYSPRGPRSSSVVRRG